MYLIALGIIHLLVPRLEPADFKAAVSKKIKEYLSCAVEEPTSRTVNMARCATKPIASKRNNMLEAGAQAHCKRVAAWCEELSLVLGIPGGDASALQEAAYAPPSTCLSTRRRFLPARG